MLELLILIAIIIPVVLLSYKTGRKNKKCEINVMSLLALGSVFASILIYTILHFDMSIFEGNIPNISVTEFDY